MRTLKKWLAPAIALLVCAVLYVQHARQPRADDPALSFTPIPIAQANVGASVRIAGVWAMRSDHKLFGSYSGLTHIGGSTFLAVSDQGNYLYFAAPTTDERAHQESRRSARFGSITGGEITPKSFTDTEAVTRDPKTGSLWLSYENTNIIERRRADFRMPKRRAAPQMAEFLANTGAEAMTRLSNGQFLVLSEAPKQGDVRHKGLLFLGDPVEGAKAVAFSFVPPKFYRPTDMAQIPDGRVVILLRRVVPGLLPRFASKIILADPAAIALGKTWQGQELAAIAVPNPNENYEGIAVGGYDGRNLALWLIADDNRNRLQRTLLMHLTWTVHSPAQSPH